MKTQSGFTLVELMIALAVVAVIVTIGIPNFTDLIRNSRQTTQINSLLNAMSVARSEAVKLNRFVTVCQSSDGATCGDAGWNNGWIVFRDDGVAGRVDGNDALLQTFPKLAGGNALVSQEFPAFLSFDGEGATNATGSFVLCDSRGVEHAVALCVTPTGRIYTSQSACNGGVMACP